MEYALQVAGPYQELLDAASFAADRGMVALALPDHYLLALEEEQAKTKPAPDAFVQFGGLARVAFYGGHKCRKRRIAIVINDVYKFKWHNY